MAIQEGVDISDINGNYQFSDINVGQCYIQVTPNDNNYVFSPMQPPNGNVVDSSGTSPDFEVIDQEVFDQANVGMHYPPAIIGPGPVFEDPNQNGVQNPGEVGIPGVLIELQCDEDGEYVVIETDITDANGEYAFEVVYRGTCRICAQPDNPDYDFSPPTDSSGCSPSQFIDYGYELNWPVGLYNTTTLSPTKAPTVSEPYACFSGVHRCFKI